MKLAPNPPVFHVPTVGRQRKLQMCIVIADTLTARIQETHILIGHIFCDLVKPERVVN